MIYDTLISRILHCQNVFPKLINVLDLTFVQVFNPFTRDSVYQVVIIIIIIVLVTRKLPLRVSQGTVATFYRCGGQSYNRLFSIFRIVHTENYKNRLIFDWVISRVVVLVPRYLTSCVLAITLVIGPPVYKYVIVFFLKHCIEWVCEKLTLSGCNSSRRIYIRVRVRFVHYTNTTIRATESLRPEALALVFFISM